MKIFYLLTSLSLLTLLYCRRSKQSELFPGLWKIAKIEVLTNDTLKKTIDTGYQYWNFYKDDSLVISERDEVENSLQIKVGAHSIKSIDKNNRVDELFIDHLNKEKLELSSKQRLNEQVYTIVYYLEKVKDSARGMDREGQ